eukprot:scaffold179176_cov35-Tisochrysis_lutea.AAC.1
MTRVASRLRARANVEAWPNKEQQCAQSSSRCLKPRERRDGLVDVIGKVTYSLRIIKRSS